MAVTRSADAGDPKPTWKQRQNQFALAFWIVGFVGVAITVLAVTVIITAPASQKTDVANDMFVALLPVFSAWVGAVIAFYFGQQNFESASEQAQALVGFTGLDVRTPVTDVMQSIHAMVTYKMSGSMSEVALSELDSDAYLGGVNRLLLVDEAEHPLLLIHRSRLVDYFSSGGDRNGTLDDFIESEQAKSPPVRYDAGRGFVTLDSTANLSAAKVAMESAPGVADIIVTRAGGVDEPVWGWITDVTLRESLKA